MGSADMELEIVDPVGRPDTTSGEYAPRPDTIEGLSIALLDNVKANSAKVLSLAYRQLRDRYGLGDPTIASKGTATHPAPEVLIDKIRVHDAVIIGVGD